jgi:hypothetical protein
LRAEGREQRVKKDAGSLRVEEMETIANKEFSVVKGI